MADPKPTLTLPDYAHRPGCPGERVETFRIERPHGRGYSVVTRCVECGGQVSDDHPTTREEGDHARP